MSRYSEDLDFSLMVPDAAFDLAAYLFYVEKELRAYNFTMTVRKKEKIKGILRMVLLYSNRVCDLQCSSNEADVEGSLSYLNGMTGKFLFCFLQSAA